MENINIFQSHVYRTVLYRYIYVRIGTCGIHNTRPVEDTTAQKPKINFTLFSVLFSPTCKNNTPRAFESSCERRRIITPERTSMICYTWCIILWLFLFVPDIYLYTIHIIRCIYLLFCRTSRGRKSFRTYTYLCMIYTITSYISFHFILPIVSILTVVQYLYNIPKYIPRAKRA